MAVIAFLCVVGCVLLLIQPTLISSLYFRRNMSAAQAARYNALIKNPITIPPSLLTSAPYPPDVLRGLNAMNADYAVTRTATTVTLALDQRDTGQALSTLQHGDPVSEDAWTTFAAIHSVATPLLETTSHTCNLPGYQMNANPDLYLVGGGIPHLRIAQVAAISAHCYARDAQWTSATCYALLPFYQAQGNPVRTLSDMFVSQRLVRIGTDCIADIGTSSTERESLEVALNELIRLRSDVISTTSIPIAAREWIAELRHFAASGLPVTLTSGRSAYQYMSQGMRASVPFSSMKVATLPVGSPERANHERWVKEFGYIPELHMSGSTLLTLCDFLAPDFLAAKLIDIEDQYNSANETEAIQRYDLAILKLAMRLAQLDGVALSSQSQLMPAYMPHLLIDPAVGSPYSWDAATNRFTASGGVALPGHKPADPTSTF